MAIPWPHGGVLKLEVRKGSRSGQEGRHVFFNACGCGGWANMNRGGMVEQRRLPIICQFDISDLEVTPAYKPLWGRVWARALTRSDREPTKKPSLNFVFFSMSPRKYRADGGRSQGVKNWWGIVALGGRNRPCKRNGTDANRENSVPISQHHHPSSRFREGNFAKH